MLDFIQGIFTLSGGLVAVCVVVAIALAGIVICRRDSQGALKTAMPRLSVMPMLQSVLAGVFVPLPKASLPVRRTTVTVAPSRGSLALATEATRTGGVADAFDPAELHGDWILHPFSG